MQDQIDKGMLPLSAILIFAGMAILFKGASVGAIVMLIGILGLSVTIFKSGKKPKQLITPYKVANPYGSDKDDSEEEN